MINPTNEREKKEMLIKRELTGVCARSVEIIINNGIVNGCHFTGGCDGHGKSLNSLIAGMPVDWVIDRLKDIHCGKKNTSCAAELAAGIREAVTVERGE